MNPAPIRLVRMVTKIERRKAILFTIRTRRMGSRRHAMFELACHLTLHPHKADGGGLDRGGLLNRQPEPAR